MSYVGVKTYSRKRQEELNEKKVKDHWKKMTNIQNDIIKLRKAQSKIEQDGAGSNEDTSSGSDDDKKGGDEDAAENENDEKKKQVQSPEAK